MADGSTQHDPVTMMATALDSARRELEEAWKDCRPTCDSAERLFHYTSLEGLLGIVKHKTLWLSNVSTFNDTSELHYGGEVIMEVINEALHSQPPGQNLAPDLEAAVEKGKRFIEHLPSHYYAFCFCSDHDRLCQWRAYGAGAAGFEIGFSRSRLEGYLASKRWRVSDPMPMLYGKPRMKKAARRFISKAQAIAGSPEHALKGGDLDKLNDEFAFKLFLFPLAVKNPSFSEEKEWRIIQVGFDQKDVKFRPHHGITLPYLELPGVPPEVFVSVTLGPKVDPDFADEPMRLFLKCNELGHVEVRPSKIPLRAPS